MIPYKVGLIFLGSFALILGLGKILWEMWSWSTLSQLGERPPLYGDDPRVEFRLYVAVAAAGATILALGILI